MKRKDMIQAGVGVMIVRNKKVLLGKRLGIHSGEYAFPGGRLEFGESIEKCAKREALEETGFKIRNVKFLMFKNMTEYVSEGKHYAHISVLADAPAGKPKICEPDKAEGWKWYNFNKLPHPLFGPIKQTIESYKTKKPFFDSR